MATITAEEIIDRAAILLHDNQTNVRWPKATEQLGWLNDGQQMVVLLKPDAYTQNESVQMTAGTKQSIPSNGLMLLDVPRNMGAAGTTPGKVVRRIDRRELDDQIPDWHSATAVAAVDHYVFDIRDPRRFYVYPPSDGTGHLEQIFSAAPPAVAAIGSVISLDDIYSVALLDYIMFRSYSKDVDYAANAARAQFYYTAFLQSLGRMDLIEARQNPNLPAMMRAQAEAQQT
jgi:hypothetical protein